MLSDTWMPTFDTSDELAIVVDADAAATWHALLAVDLAEVGRTHHVAGFLSGLRAVPMVLASVLHRRLPERPPATMRLRDLGKLEVADGGWVLLDERPFTDLIFGLAGKFWKPNIEFAPVTRGTFRSFDTPGYARTLYAFECRAIDANHTLVRAVMRTATTDEHARKWFKRYWMSGVGLGARAVVYGVLDLVRQAAEAEAAEIPDLLSRAS